MRGYPYLYMQFSKKPEFVFHPDWYRDLEYPKEQERGYASREDLYVPGYFELPIKKGESIIFAASTSKSDTATLAPIFEEEREAHPEGQLRTLSLQRRPPVSQPLERGRELYPGGIPVVQMPRTRHLYRPCPD